LKWQSDPRSSCQFLEKKVFRPKDWNVQLDEAPEKNVGKLIFFEKLTF